MLYSSQVERDRFARKVGRRVGNFVEERIMDADITDAFIIGTLLGTGLLLKDYLSDAGISRSVKKSIVQIIQRTKF